MKKKPHPSQQLPIVLMAATESMGGSRAEKINSSTREEVSNILELAAGQLFWKTF